MPSASLAPEVRNTVPEFFSGLRFVDFLACGSAGGGTTYLDRVSSSRSHTQEALCKEPPHPGDTARLLLRLSAHALLCTRCIWSLSALKSLLQVQAGYVDLGRTCLANHSSKLLHLLAARAASQHPPAHKRVHRLAAGSLSRSFSLLQDTR